MAEKVYLLYQYDGRGERLMGAFSTEEKAMGRVTNMLEQFQQDNTLNFELIEYGAWANGSCLVVYNINPLNFPESTQFWYRYVIRDYDVE